MSKAQTNIDTNIYSDLNCIWTISNMIGIKLCDKSFDCGNCPLDIVLRNLTDNNTNKVTGNYSLIDIDFIDRIINTIQSTELKNNYIYIRNNWVLKNLYANIYYLGINPAAVPLLENISDIKEYMKKVYFISGQKLLILEGEWGSIELPAPINFLLLDKLNWTPEEIIANKWIAIIAANQNEIQDAVISTDQWKLEKSKLAVLLSEYKDCCLLIETGRSGNEKKIKCFHRLIGSLEYRKLLNRIFNE